MATDVTVVGVAGTTVTIPFTSADNYVLAQLAASAINSLADGAKFMASGTAVTAATGIMGNVDGAAITGTSANSTVIAGGANFAYSAAADGQRVFFSASGGGNRLGNAGLGTMFSLDAGGNASVYGTSLDATGGTATVNSYSGYLSVRSESGGLVTVNVAPGTTQGIAYSGAEGLVVNDAARDNLALTSPDRVTVNANGANITVAGGGAFFVNTTASNTITNNGAGFASIGGSGAVTLLGGAFVTGPGPSLTAAGTANVINSGTGVSVGLVDGAAVTVQAFPFTAPADTVFAAGTGSVLASGAQALIIQQAAANLSIGTAWAGQATVNAAAGATETLSYLGALAVNATDDNLTLAGSGVVTVIASGSNTLTATASGPVSLTGTGDVILAGGNFYTGPGNITLTGGTNSVPNLTATGTGDVINSGAAIAVTLAGGAAATVQAFPFTTPADTVTALGAGSIVASGVTAVVNQTGAGDLVIGEAYGGLVTVNAASGATEALNASTIPGIALTYNLAGGNFNITGNRPTVNATGADTVSFTGPNPAIVNQADGASLNLAGGQFYVSTAGAGAGVTFSGADTITFAAGTNPANLLAAQAGSLLGGAGDADGNIFDTAGGGTFLITGNDANTGFYIIDPGATNNVLYLGTPYRTDIHGTVIETYASATDLIANNVVVWGGSGSQTVFGGGNAFGTGVAFAEYGGAAGNNLLVGAQEIHGGGEGDTLQAGAFTSYIQAAAANTTLIGGNGSFNGASTFAAADETLLGAGGDTFVFGTGNASITGNGGANLYTDLNQTAAGTTITITDFTSGTDQVDLFSLSNASLSGATANVSGQTQSDTGDALVTLSDGVTIRFQGLGTVSSTDFVTNVGTVQVGKVT